MRAQGGNRWYMEGRVHDADGAKERRRRRGILRQVTSACYGRVTAILFLLGFAAPVLSLAFLPHSLLVGVLLTPRLF